MINELKVMKIIEKMQIKKTFGCDGITNEILKCSSPVFENSLANAFKKCIVEGTFPKSLKIGKVAPLHKTGDRKKIRKL